MFLEMNEDAEVRPLALSASSGLYQGEHVPERRAGTSAFSRELRDSSIVAKKRKLAMVSFCRPGSLVYRGVPKATSARRIPKTQSSIISAMRVVTPPSQGLHANATDLGCGSHWQPKASGSQCPNEELATCINNCRQALTKHVLPKFRIPGKALVSLLCNKRT